MDDERLAAACREFGVVFAYLFGSRARGDHRHSSDTDVAVLLDRSLGLLERERLAGRLADALGVADVDLLVLNDAALELRGRVVQEGRPVFVADESRRVGFEVRTRSEYFDFLPTLQALTEAYLRRAAGKAG